MVCNHFLLEMPRICSQRRLSGETGELYPLESSASGNWELKLKGSRQCALRVIREKREPLALGAQTLHFLTYLERDYLFPVLTRTPLGLGMLTTPRGAFPPPSPGV